MSTALANPLGALDGKVSAASLLTAASETELYRHDVYASGPAPLAVFRPATVEELAAGIGAATARLVNPRRSMVRTASNMALRFMEAASA